MVSMTLPQYRRRECALDDRTVRLLPMDCKTLALLLVAGPDRFVPRQELVEAIWPNAGQRPTHAFKMIDICICRLRKHGAPVETMWGVGWRIPRYARLPMPQKLAA